MAILDVVLDWLVLLLSSDLLFCEVDPKLQTLNADLRLVLVGRPTRYLGNLSEVELYIVILKMCQLAQCLHRVLPHHDVVDFQGFKDLLHNEVSLLLDWEVLLGKLDRSQESLGGHRCGWEPIAFLVVDGCDQSADNLVLDGRVQVSQLELLTDEAEGLKRRLLYVEPDVSRIAAQDVDQFGPLLERNVNRSDRGDQVRDLRPHILRGAGELGEHGLLDHGFEVGVQFDP